MHLAAEPLEQLAERGRLVLDLGGRVGTVAGPARVKVQGQHPASGRGWVINRHRTRLVRRGGRKRASAARRVGAAAVARHPDVRRSGDRGRDGPPGRLSGMRRKCRHALRRVARGQC